MGPGPQQPGTADVELFLEGKTQAILYGVQRSTPLTFIKLTVQHGFGARTGTFHLVNRDSGAQVGHESTVGSLIDANSFTAGGRYVVSLDIRGSEGEDFVSWVSPVSEVSAARPHQGTRKT